MLLTWIRRLAENRFKAFARRANPSRRRRAGLGIECLEERTPPATVTWTGSLAFDIFDTNGMLIRPGMPEWSLGGNWSGGPPIDDDDVVFPSGVPAANKVPSIRTSPINSLNDILNLTLKTFTVQDSGFFIGGNTIGLTGDLLGGSDFTSGSTTITLGIRMAGGSVLKNMEVVNAGATLNLLGGLTETTPNSGIVKQGLGTLNLGGTSTYTGLTEVLAGTLGAFSEAALGTTSVGTVVRDGATLLVGADVGAEPLEIIGTGVGGAGVLRGFGSWAGPVVLAGDSSIGAGSLTISGIISGLGDVTKVGGGTLILTTDNTFAGDVLVNSGTLQLQSDVALSPGFITNVASGATLSLFGNRAIDETLFLTGPGVGGAGALQTVGGILTNNANWLGTITLLGNTSIGADEGSILTITGDFSDDPSLSSGADLTKVGLGTLILPNANPNFNGNTFINRGILIMRDGLSLGPTVGGGSVTVNNPGTLRLEGNFTTTKPLTINGLGADSLGALRTVLDGTAVDWAGPVTIATTSLIALDPMTQLTISGVVGGPGNAAVEKTGGGTLILTGTNTYLGPTTLREGLTRIIAGSSLGGDGGFGTTVSNGATLEFQGGITVDAEPLTISGTGLMNMGVLRSVSGNNVWSSIVNLLGVSGGETASINVVADSLTFNNIVSGSANLVKIGDGTLILDGSQANTSTGSTTVNTGTLVLSKDDGLKAIGGNLTVGDGSGLELARLDASNQIIDTATVRVNSSGLFDLNNNSETIGALILQAGTVTTGSGILTLGGNVTALAFASPATINGLLSLGGATRTFDVEDGAADDDLVVNAVVTGETGAGLTKAGDGRMILNAVNGYSGPTTVNAGLLRLGAVGAIPVGGAVVIASGGTLDLNDFNQSFGSLAGAGNLDLGSATLTVGTDGTNTEFSGPITGTGGLTKVGTGTLTLSGNSPSFTGPTAINAGVLLANGGLGGSNFTVAAAGTLGGTGTVGAVAVTGGTVSPGVTAGRLTASGNVSFNSASSFVADINGLTAGIEYDQFDVTGTVNLGGSALALRVGAGFAPNIGDSFTIIQSTGGVSGEFLNLTDGATFSVGGVEFQIDYTANDVVVTATGLANEVSLVSSANPSVFGQSVTFTFELDPETPGAPTPTGTIEFFDGTTSLGIQPLMQGPSDSGQASVSTAALLGGTHNISAAYNGDGNYGPITVALSPPQVVNPAPTTTAVVSSDPMTSFGEDVTFTATVTFDTSLTPAPTGMVTFVDVNTGTTLGSSMLNASQQATLTTDEIAVGTHTIQATYSGDSNYATSSGTTTQEVTQLTTTTTLTNGDTDGMSIFGEPVVFTANVTSNTGVTPVGTVTFVDTTTNTTLDTVDVDGSGNAVLSVDGLDVGPHAVVAMFNANNNFGGSTSNTVSQTVSQGATTTSLTTSDNMTVFGEPVTFTATVTPAAPSTRTPTGSVNFIDVSNGNALLGTVALDSSGVAELTVNNLGLGTHTITAVYNDADANYASSTDSVSQQVDPAATTTTVTAAPNPSVFGQVVTVTATVDAAPGVLPPTGSVSFFFDGNPAQTVALDASGQASIQTDSLSVGSHAITAQFIPNNTNFLGSTSPAFTQNVNSAPTVTTISTSDATSAPGQTVTFTATVDAPASGATPTGSVTFSIDGVTATVVPVDSNGRATFSTSSIALGTHAISAEFIPNNVNFLASGTSLAQRVRSDLIVVGADAGLPPHVKAYDADTGAEVRSFFAFDPSFTSGVRVATGDVNGDGRADIIAGAGIGAPNGHVKVFDGATGAEIRSFFAFEAFTGGVQVAAGDINNDGFADVIVGSGPGGAHVKVFDGRTGAEVRSFIAFTGFTGGVTVAAGDVNGDGRDDIVVGSDGGAQNGHVKVFDSQGGEIQSYFAYVNYTGGVNVAAGDIDGDGRADIITGAGNAAAHVKVFNGASQAEVRSFIAYPGAPVGVRVGAVDRDGDGRADIITGPAGIAPHVRIFNGLTLADLDSFFAFEGATPSAGLIPIGGNPRGGIYVGGSF